MPIRVHPPWKRKGKGNIKPAPTNSRAKHAQSRNAEIGPAPQRVREKNEIPPQSAARLQIMRRAIFLAGAKRVAKNRA